MLEEGDCRQPPFPAISLYKNSPLPVDPVKAEHLFFIEIEIIGQEVASRKTSDLKKVFGSDCSHVAGAAAADVTEGECRLVANRSKDGLLLLCQQEAFFSTDVDWLDWGRLPSGGSGAAGVVGSRWASMSVANTSREPLHAG